MKYLMFVFYMLYSVCYKSLCVLNRSIWGKNDEKDENSVLIKIVLIYRGSAYGNNRRRNCGEVHTKRTH
mgnify:CR=1 FL=1